MANVGEKRLQIFLAQYNVDEINDAYLALYEDQGDVARVFACLHQRIDAEFDWMNFKARNGHSGHFKRR